MIEFEPMKKEHIGGLKAVEEECFNSGYAEKTFLKELENKISFYIVAKECEKIVGYIGLWNILGEVEVINIAVLKSYRRRGIAQSLLEEAERECKRQNAFKINLEVRASNIPAQSLYKKMGFLENGLRKRYYENKEDAILMEKLLDKGETL